MIDGRRFNEEQLKGMAGNFSWQIKSQHEKSRLADARLVAKYIAATLELTGCEVMVDDYIFDAYIFGQAPNFVDIFFPAKKIKYARDKIEGKAGELMIVRYLGAPSYGEVGQFDSGTSVRYLLEPSLSGRTGRAEAAFAQAEDVTPVVLGRFSQRQGDYSNTQVNVSNSQSKIYVGNEGWRDYKEVARSETELNNARVLLGEQGHTLD